MDTSLHLSKIIHAFSQYSVVVETVYQLELGRALDSTSLWYPAPRFFLFRTYSIEDEGLGNTFTFYVTFPGMLAVAAVHNE